MKKDLSNFKLRNPEKTVNPEIPLSWYRKGAPIPNFYGKKRKKK